MPELPEVETIRRGLDERLPGLKIAEVEVRVPKMFIGRPEDVLDRTVIGLERQGKLLIIRLEAGLLITVHLKMTGQLIWQPARTLADAVPDEEERDNATASFDSAEEDDDQAETVMGGHPEKSYLQPLPHRHTHVIFTFDDGSHLYFNDLRKFGRVTVLLEEELPQTAFIEKLGPEPLQAGFTREYLAEQLKKRGRAVIKSFLLDQRNIAGLGNIYADESLFRAAILPDRLAGDLKPGELSNLYEAIQETLELAILHGGSSSHDYVNAVGEKGTFMGVANVYHRTGELCSRCHEGLIQRKKIGGRSSHYCPVCQR
jgi:formamidopyrimidine-DNA glycosylase